MKKIGIHGSTGSIGTQALEIIRNDKDITCVYLTAYSNVDLLISQARVKIKSKVDKNLLRPSDVTLQIPDSSKFIRKTKWKQMYSVDESIKFLLGIWRKKYNCE